MDTETLVRGRLLEQDQCVACVQCSQLEDGGKSTRIIALIANNDEFGVVLFSCNKWPALAPGDLTVAQGIPVDPNLSFSIVGQPAEGSVPVKLTYEQRNLVLDLPADGFAVNKLLSELKAAILAQTQKKIKGLPPSFNWINRYKPAQTALSNPNPFAEDTFDPLKAEPGSNNESPDGWPWSHILRLPDDGDLCPVVRDHNDRTPSMQSFTESMATDSVSSSESTSKGFYKSAKGSHSVDDLSENFKEGKPLTGRENMIRMMIGSREDDYTDIRPFRVFCGTWNVNGQPATEKLDNWLSCDPEPPDVYAIGFQELDLSKNAFIFSDSPREIEWFQKVQHALHPKAKYKKLKLIRLVGMMLIVFIQERHVPHISDVIAETVGTGIMGMMGNKGGVGVRFYLHNTSICFVNTHLAAHTEEYERRNQDFRDINSRMNFGNRSPPLNISDHKMVFWIGDLNYRLSDIENETVKRHIEKESYDKLMKYDQLVRQIDLKKVFLDYTEGNITFQPTYKYDPGTDNWDTSEKCRTPAWCDRILWRGQNIDQAVYRSHMNLKLSDHKPVSSVFNIGVKVVDHVRYKKVYEDVLKQLDRLENEFLPQVSLNKTELRFKDVQFIEARSETIVVSNTGQVPVQFEFIKKLDDPHFCKLWLNITPSKAVIMTGESCEIHFEVYVDKDTAPKLNTGMDKIEDILILHLERGKDFFIPVSGNYIPSSFGMSIKSLIQMYQPMREVPMELLAKLEKINIQALENRPDTERPLDVPRELWRLVDHIYRYGMTKEDLFLQPGLHPEIVHIRNALDGTGMDILPGSMNSVAEALLLFLECLAEPVIPYEFYYKCLECCKNHMLCKQAVSQMPTCHQTVFKYLTAFLRTLLRQAHSNNLDTKFLATQFGGIILRTPVNARSQGLITPASRRSQQQAEETKKAAFLYHFLVNDSLD